MKVTIKRGLPLKYSVFHLPRDLWEFIEAAGNVINQVTNAIKTQGEKITTILKAPPSKRY